MQNYGQPPPGYQRPGSTTSFVGQQPPPPPQASGYGGYQSAAPQAQSQWAPPAQNQITTQQWNQQQQQQASVYNPGIYGTMPGVQQAPHAYASQQHDQPPPPPPKPHGFAAAVQQQQQHQQQQSIWSQQSQQDAGFTPQQQQQQGGYPVQAGAQQGTVQQPYNHIAPPPPSGALAGSYFPTPQGGRPSSLYGAAQIGSFTNVPSAGPPQSSSVASPNEQQPAYIPPSLTGQGVQAYLPSDTNPMPGVYVPPPPDVPAWQQVQHAPLQGGSKKFKYTKPTVDSSFYAQGYQGVPPTHQPPPLPPRVHEQYVQAPMLAQTPPQPFGPPGQNQYVPHGNMPLQPPPPLDHNISQQQQQAQFGQIPQLHQQPYRQPMQMQSQYLHQPTSQLPYDPPTHEQQVHQPLQHPQPSIHGASNLSMPFDKGQGASNMSKPVQQSPGWVPQPVGASNVSKPYEHRPEWDQYPGASNVSKPFEQKPGGSQRLADQFPSQPEENMPAPYGTPQSQWQPGPHPTQSSVSTLVGPPYPHGPGQDMQAPKPLSRSDTASSTFFDQPSPQSQPVSPINHRNSVSFASAQNTGLGRASSVSSIALANLHAQREGSKTSSPRPAPPKFPTPPPPRDDKSKFSVLGSGGPSDWEHFGADAEIDDEEIFAKKPRPAQLDSVELPASVPESHVGPSPPSTHGWPSPTMQPAPLHHAGGLDVYQPTPPPAIATLADRPISQPSQQECVLRDAVPAPLKTSPKPAVGAQPPSTQSSVPGDGAWAPPNESVHGQEQLQHQSLSFQENFVMHDGGRAAQPIPAQGREQSPIQMQYDKPSLATTGFAETDSVRNTSQRTPTQETSHWRAPTNQDYASMLKDRDEMIQHLQADYEKDMINLRAEIEELKVDRKAASSHAVDEQAILHEKLEGMRIAAEQAKSLADATAKEINLTIERLKEDVEGKEHNIEERDTSIADLRRQLEDRATTIANLNHQLEVEKAKEPLKATPGPADLIPDINPWYVGSLERYITMLRNEASEPKVEDKIRTFKNFLRAESTVRGIDFFDAPPPPPANTGINHGDMDSAPSLSKSLDRSPDLGIEVSSTSKPSGTKKNLIVNVPHDLSPNEDDEYEYSPGGRPVLRKKAAIPSNENASIQRHSQSSAHSTTVLTPTSSVDDDINKTPIQSPPEEQPQPQYKAYVPPAAMPSDPAPPAHRQTMSFSSIPTVGSPSSSSKTHDEIFFIPPQSEASKPAMRPTSSGSVTPAVSIPEPLSFPSDRSASTASQSQLQSRKDSPSALAELLPSRSMPAMPNRFVEEMQARLSHSKQDDNRLEELTKAWELSATSIRRNNDSARRRRQEEHEDSNTEAFDNDELSYTELKELEKEFKQKEGELKKEEDQAEYNSYVEAVFDKVYDSLQSEIKELMDLYAETEDLVHTSVTGLKSLKGGTAPSTLSCLELLKDVHDSILKRQDNVVQAVSERDKRYKKTQIQPLYAAGNISKMKDMEKHFEKAEKQAVVRAKRERAARVGELVTLAEDIVVTAVSTEQREIDAIISALRDLSDTPNNDITLIAIAHDSLTALKSSSRSLLKYLNTLEISLNAAVLDAEIAHAWAEGADAARVQELGNQKIKEEGKLKEEFERKVKVLEQDREEIEELVESKGAKVGGEGEKEKRLKAALEEAKRRNGDA